MIDFSGDVGEGLKERKNPLPSSGMGGKGVIDSPVENFTTNSAKSPMSKASVPGKNVIDSPAI
jgi:hypothetical protein